jgi:hypothetical protein
MSELLPPVEVTSPGTSGSRGTSGSVELAQHEPSILVRVKEPATSDQRANLMEPFVVASKTTTALRDACELLFIHGNDLTWGGPEFGIFLVDKELDDISDTLEVDRYALHEARSSGPSSEAPSCRS